MTALAEVSNAIGANTTTDPRPVNVVEALARVTAEIGGIEKLTTSERRARGLGGGDAQGITYAYRGIDQIAAAAQPLFGRYGIVIVPLVIDQSVKEITVNAKPWSDTFVTVDWTIYGPGGVEDRIQATTTGVGRDNSDKGVNKAMTTAFKNLLLRLLCIGDAKDDTDNAEPAVRSSPEPTAPQEPKLLTARQVDAATKTAMADGAQEEDVSRWVHEATKGRTTLLEEMFDTDLPALRVEREKWLARTSTDGDETPAPTLALEPEGTP